jgi:hypothetical protein
VLTIGSSYHAFGLLVQVVPASRLHFAAYTKTVDDP